MSEFMNEKEVKLMVGVDYTTGEDYSQITIITIKKQND